MNKQDSLEVLKKIKENINTCCAITMEPDEVLLLCDELENYLKNINEK